MAKSAIQCPHTLIPLLKLKCYLISSADVEQLQDQQQLPVEENKDGSLPGPPTYASGLTTKIKPYDGKIKPAEFCKQLEQAKQSFKQKCDKEGEETTLSKTRRLGPSSSRGHGSLPAKMITLKKERVKKARKKRKSAKEHQGRADQACPRTPREDRAEPPTKNPNQAKMTEWRPGNTKNTPIERDWDPQGNGGATEAPDPQVVRLGQR